MANECVHRKKVRKMDLLVDFECPECRKLQPQKVADLGPGNRQTCLGCGTATVLTEAGLEGLQHRLVEFCRD